jgi:uncharacterized phage infection (PIP) family protein YhgE
MSEEISPLENHGWWMERLRKDAKANRPEALRLADIIEQDPTTTWGYREASHAAAAELRRLHAEVNELKRTLALQQQSYEREIQIEVEAEREACAKVAKETVCDMHLGTGIKIYGTKAAAAIRARGQA